MKEYKLNSDKSFHSKSIVCPHCSATEFTFISHGLAKCNYCGSSIILPKREQPKKEKPTLSKITLLDLINGGLPAEEETHPRQGIVRPLKHALPAEKAKEIATASFKKTMPLWIATLIFALVTVALLIYTACCLGGVDALVATIVPTGVTLITIIITGIFEAKSIKKPLLDEQNKTMQEISRQLASNNFAPLNEVEIDHANSMTKVNASYIRSKVNLLQGITIALTSLIALACLIIAPVRANTSVASSGGHYHYYDNGCDSICNLCGERRTPYGHIYGDPCDESCSVCGYIREVTHIDTDGTGICYNCGEEFILQYFSFTLNSNGESYTLTGVSETLQSSSFKAKTIQLPSVYEGKPVTAIGSNAFTGTGQNVTIIIPSSIIKLLPNAFTGTLLRDVEFEEQTDWYLVEEGQWLSEVSDWLSSTNASTINLLFFYGDNTWIRASN